MQEYAVTVSVRDAFSFVFDIVTVIRPEPRKLVLPPHPHSHEDRGSLDRLDRVYYTSGTVSRPLETEPRQRSMFRHR